jgi:hypothetical protein
MYCCCSVVVRVVVVAAVVVVVTELLDGTLEHILFKSPVPLSVSQRLQFGLEIAQGYGSCGYCDYYKVLTLPLL